MREGFADGSAVADVAVGVVGGGVADCDSVVADSVVVYWAVDWGVRECVLGEEGKG